MVWIRWPSNLSSWISEVSKTAESTTYLGINPMADFSFSEKISAYVQSESSPEVAFTHNTSALSMWLLVEREFQYYF